MIYVLNIINSYLHDETFQALSISIYIFLINVSMHFSIYDLHATALVKTRLRSMSNLFTFRITSKFSLNA